MLECFKKQILLKYIVHLLNKYNKQYGLKFRQLLFYLSLLGLIHNAVFITFVHSVMLM